MKSQYVINEPFSPRRKLGLTRPQRQTLTFLLFVVYIVGYFVAQYLRNGFIWRVLG